MKYVNFVFSSGIFLPSNHFMSISKKTNINTQYQYALGDVKSAESTNQKYKPKSTKKVQNAKKYRMKSAKKYKM